MHDQDRLEWNQDSTVYSFPVFIVWQTVYKNEKIIQKDWAVVNIQDLNQVTVSDVYSLSLQSDITVLIKECQYISVMNDTDFFYQWQVAQADREKFTIVSHWELEILNVILMNYKESSSYSQQMMNWILHFYKNFIRFYINDLIIFSKILNNHKQHLNIIWSLFDEIRISLNEVKIYLDYSSIIFLE